MIRILIVLLVLGSLVAIWTIRSRHVEHVLETFDTTAEGTVPKNWTVSNATWSVAAAPGQGRELRETAAMNESIATFGSASWTDYSIQCAVRADRNNPSTSVSVLGRVRDVEHFYQFELKEGTTWGLYKRDGAKWTQLAEGPYKYKAGVYYTLKLTLAGPSLVGSLSTDGGATFNILVAKSDYTYSAGMVGLRCASTGARFDNLQVAAP
jgi:hypothetical protein